MIVVVLIGLVGMLHHQSANVRDLQRQVAEANAKFADKSRTGTLDLQAKCAEQARKDFADWGYNGKDKLADFVSHYNPKFDRCFIHIQYTYGTEPLWTSRVVYDAFERKGYGKYLWHTDKVRKFWEVPPVECEVPLPTGDNKTCHSDEEFTELIKVYMGEGDLH
jgi:hypothetical protein